MFKAFRDAFKIPELRQRIIFTLLALIAFRVGIYIPIPGINVQAWQAALGGVAAGALGGFIGFLTSLQVERLAIYRYLFFQ